MKKVVKRGRPSKKSIVSSKLISTWKPELVKMDDM